MRKLFLTLFIVNIVCQSLFSQQIKLVNPSCANPGQTLNVNLTGVNTKFAQATGATIDFYQNIPWYYQGSSTSIVNFTTPLNDSNLVANVSVSSNATTGYYHVNSQEYVGSFDYSFSKKDGFYVNAPLNPKLYSVNPNNANNGQTLNVTITGLKTHFLQGSGTVLDFYQNIPWYYQTSSTSIINSQFPLNDTTLLVNVTIPNNFTSGYLHAIYKENYASIDYMTTINNCFYVNAPSNPRLKSLTPNYAMPGQTLNVSLTGSNTHFTQVSSTLFDFFPEVPWYYSASGTIINSFTPVNDTLGVLNITTPINSLPRYLDVYYIDYFGTTSYNTLKKDGFCIGPCITGILPDSTGTNQTITTTITCVGSNFTGSLTPSNVWLSNNDLGCESVISASSVTVLNSVSIRATFFIPSNALHSLWDMNIVNGSLGYFLKEKSFSVMFPFSNVSSLGKVEKSFIIYPNPSNNLLNIKSDFDFSSEITIEIYDLIGKKIYYETIKKPDVTFSKTINLTKLLSNSGSYILLLKTEKNIQTSRFIYIEN